MAIFNKRIPFIIVLLLDFCFITLSMYANKKSVVKKVRITYNTLDGYATKQYVANYILCKNNYVLIKNDWSQNVVRKIRKEYVENLINNCSNNNNICDYLKITKEDYNKFQKLISLPNDSLIYYMVLDSLKEENYYIDENKLLSISCMELFELIRKDHYFKSLTPSFKIELINSCNDIITIEPMWYFEDSPWMMKKYEEEKYISFDTLMLFLRSTGYDKYTCFYGREYYIYQIISAKINSTNDK